MFYIKLIMGGIRSSSFYVFLIQIYPGSGTTGVYPGSTATGNLSREWNDRDLSRKQSHRDSLLVQRPTPHILPPVGGFLLASFPLFPHR